MLVIQVFVCHIMGRDPKVEINFKNIKLSCHREKEKKGILKWIYMKCLQYLFYAFKY